MSPPGAARLLAGQGARIEHRERDPILGAKVDPPLDPELRKPLRALGYADD